MTDSRYFEDTKIQNRVWICKHHMPRWKTNGVFFALNQTIQSTEEVRTNSMENNIQHRYKYCLDMWAIVLEMLFQIWYR